MTPTPAVLDTLLARVRAATGPDRELDAALMPLAGYVVYTQPWERHHPQWSPRSGGIVLDVIEDTRPFTRSLDDTTAAVASRGLGWQVDQTEGATVSDEHDQWHETCATPVLSLVGAWLVAEMERADAGE